MATLKMNNSCKHRVDSRSKTKKNITSMNPFTEGSKLGYMVQGSIQKCDDNKERRELTITKVRLIVAFRVERTDGDGEDDVGPFRSWHCSSSYLVWQFHKCLQLCIRILLCFSVLSCKYVYSIIFFKKEFQMKEKRMSEVAVQKNVCPNLLLKMLGNYAKAQVDLPPNMSIFVTYKCNLHMVKIMFAASLINKE